MDVYLIRFWFDHGGTCLWGKNELTKEKYGYAIENNQLPITNELIHILNELNDKYVYSLNWANPLDPAPWTKEDRAAFRNLANEAYLRLVKELGQEYEIINDIESSIYEKD